MKQKAILTGLLILLTTPLIMAQPRPPQIPDGNPVPLNNLIPALLFIAFIFLMKKEESD